MIRPFKNKPIFQDILLMDLVRQRNRNGRCVKKNWAFIGVHRFQIKRKGPIHTVEGRIQFLK